MEYKVLDRIGRKVNIFEKWEIKSGIPYTPESRFIQLAEECSELIQTCTKMLRISNHEGGIDKTGTYENLLEEIADVEIVLGQVKNMLLPGAANDIEHIKLEKLSREQQRLMSDC